MFIDSTRKPIAFFSLFSMLDEYYFEQMKEVINNCSRTRQTMLFSATMTDQIKDLIQVSLNRPIRLFIDDNQSVAPYLRQEFIRIREHREGDREAIVAALLTRTFSDRVIIFAQTKRQCHRMHVMLGLLGLKIGELHGDLSQTQVTPRKPNCFLSHTNDFLAIGYIETI